MLTCLTLLLNTFINTQTHASPIISDYYIITDKSTTDVKINTSFTGVNLLVFGVIESPREMIIVVRGTKHRVIVNKARKILHLWLGKKHDILTIPTIFQHISSTKPLSKITDQQTLKQLNIATDISKDESYNAFTRIMQKRHLYSRHINKITIIGDRLFRDVIALPSNIYPGKYMIELFLFKNKKLYNRHFMRLTIRKDGLNALIVKANEHHNILYTVIALSIALLVGWLISILIKTICKIR